MPQAPDSPGVTPEQWASLERPLEQDEVEAFLEHVFTNLARRPEPLTLRQVAAVVRRIRWLIDEGVPKELIEAGPEAIAAFQGNEQSEEHRRLVFNARQIADILWAKLMSMGTIQPCSKEKALAFVRRNASTHLANPYLDAAIKFLEGYDLPPNAQDPFQPPYLESKSQSSQGENLNPHLTDDLSERIYGADQVLRNLGLSRWRPLIADSLNKIGIKKRSGNLWGAEDVQQRVKEFEASRCDDDTSVERLRNHTAHMLLMAFRFAAVVEEGNRARRISVETGPE